MLQIVLAKKRENANMVDFSNCVSMKNPTLTRLIQKCNCM